ncbi:MAG: hypothetical protein U5N55_12775 [Cypionkella sp.]|nr:hypothetical protein [Cypionkella sp.]
MLKATKEIREVLETSSGTPFFAAEFVAAMAKVSKDHADAAASYIKLFALPLNCGRVVFAA